MEQCGDRAAEPAVLARYAFQLAQEFSNFYHRNHVLNEGDADRKALLLATVAVAQRELTRVLGWLGISVPDSILMAVVFPIPLGPRIPVTRPFLGTGSL